MNRRIRHWLVLLLLAVLPFKAVVAAGLSCHALSVAMSGSVPGSPTHAGATHQHVPGPGHVSADQPATARSDATFRAHDHAHESSAPTPADAPSPPGASDKSCLACAAVCGATALPAAPPAPLPATAPVRDWARTTFTAPRSHIGGTLERPPRPT